MQPASQAPGLAGKRLRVRFWAEAAWGATGGGGGFARAKQGKRGGGKGRGGKGGGGGVSTKSY